MFVVVYNPRKRAPASEGDVLGMMSLGCVMENMSSVKYLRVRREAEDFTHHNRFGNKGKNLTR